MQTIQNVRKIIQKLFVSYYNSLWEINAAYMEVKAGPLLRGMKKEYKHRK